MRNRCHRDGKHGRNCKLFSSSGSLVALLKKRQSAHSRLLRRDGMEDPLKAFGNDFRARATITDAFHKANGIRRALNVE